YRPGPMKSIPIYIENKKNPNNITYLHQKLREILSDTYGVMVYQEQVMEICRKLAGYSYGHADIVRRAMAKKKPEVMLKERKSFLSGAIENGISENIANKIFDEMISFASYAFNKSHAAAYAYLAYQTAYLKCHYRGIYMASLMSSVMTGGGKLVEYISDCRNAGIEVAPPHINRSVKNFTYSDGKIYFGLLGIKNVGTGFVDTLIRERNTNGRFTSLQNFCERVVSKELNKKAVENLIKSGAFDGLGLNRRQMLENHEMFIDMASKGRRKVMEGQLNFFGSEDDESTAISVAYKPEYDRRKLFAMEMDSSGIYLSGSPLEEYEYLGELLKVWKISSIITDENPENNIAVNLLCIVQNKKIHTAKNGSNMCFLNLADETGVIDAIVFPDLYSVTASKLNQEEIIFINGRISIKDESISLICESII
ncbi:MAG: DNA polymerase III subunit alpha, partial [Ruminococcus sp.]|nr:DNA polymerase III subunit alpha [Ruminococcus sp.]